MGQKVFHLLRRIGIYEEAVLAVLLLPDIRLFGFCGGGEIFEDRMCDVRFAVENAAYALRSRRKGAGFIAFECREQKGVELFVALDNGANRRGKSIVFHDPQKILSC